MLISSFKEYHILLIQDSETQGEINEFFPGVANPLLLHIPLEIAHGIKAIGIEEALIINIPNYSYDYENPDDYRILPYTEEIPYDWGRKDA